MLDTDEIRAKLEGIKREFEELYDEVCRTIKETEGTDEQIEWQELEFYLDRAFEVLDAIEQLRALE